MFCLPSFLPKNCFLKIALFFGVCCLLKKGRIILKTVLVFVERKIGGYFAKNNCVW